MEPITDHVAQGQALWIQQYKNKPRLEALLASYTQEVQELEDAIWEVRLSRYIDNATGAQLETLARLVGQTPQGENDALLRLLVKVRIRINRSHGHFNDILAIGHLLFGDAAFSLSELYPTFMLLEAEHAWDGDVSAARVAGLLQEAAAGSVRIDLHWREEADNETFMFADGDVEELDEDTGLADDDGLVGGALMGVN